MDKKFYTSSTLAIGALLLLAMISINSNRGGGETSIAGQTQDASVISVIKNIFNISSPSSSSREGPQTENYNVSCMNGMVLLTGSGTRASPQSVSVDLTTDCDANGICTFSYDYGGVHYAGGGPDDPDHNTAGDILRDFLANIRGSLNCGYLNSEQTYTTPFPMNNCQSGEVELDVPEPQICTTPADTEVSIVSQAHADELALDDAIAQCSAWRSTCAAIPLCYYMDSTTNQNHALSPTMSSTFYQSLTVPYGNTCASQTRTCNLTSAPYKTPTVTLSGSYQYTKCTVGPKPSSTPTPKPTTTPTPTPTSTSSIRYVPPPPVTSTPRPVSASNPVSHTRTQGFGASVFGAIGNLFNSLFSR